ncbi:hypothetical protein DL769_000787 [Monosporascus sp. CRB-8-3]|nr:hypothetical protein DL769_000787 [Monosporascus sp. CRB-8-3]
MTSKSHRKESQTTSWGWPKYYMSYERRRRPRCSECDRRYGIFDMLDSFLPYVGCSWGNGSESCWTPGYEWGGGIRGMKRRKGYKSSDHWSYEYDPGIDKWHLPDYIAGRRSTKPECECEKDGRDERASNKSRRHVIYVPPHVSDRCTNTSGASRASRSTWGKAPPRGSNIIIVDDQLNYGLGNRRYVDSVLGEHRRPAPYDHRDWELSSPTSRVLWENALKRRERRLRAECWDSVNEDRPPLVGSPVQSPGKKAREATRYSRNDLGENGGGSAKRRAPKHVHFR